MSMSTGGAPHVTVQDPRAAYLYESIQHHIRTSTLVNKVEPAVIQHIATLLFEGSLSGNQSFLNDLRPLIDSVSQMASSLRAKYDANMGTHNAGGPPTPAAAAASIPHFGHVQAPGPAPWTPVLLDTLKRQIAAYKKLQNNEHSRVHALLPDAEAKGPVAPAPSVVPPERSDPYALLQQAVDTNTAQRIYIPSIMPLGIDPLELAQNRERSIENRLRARIAELQRQPTGLEDATKVRALVELKSLLLVKKQKQLRSTIIAGVRNATQLSSTIGLRDYRRVRKHTLRDARTTERLEKQQKVDRERKAKQKHLEFLQAIAAAAANMMAARKGALQRRLQFGKSVLGWWSTAEREELKRQDRNSKERLRALKADDEEAYMKLIDKEKDSRLAQLLGQTNAYLDELASLVKTQQADVVDGSAVTMSSAATAASAVAMADSGLGGGSAYAADDDGESKIDYYKVAHKITEEVTEQPTLLTGGKLKDYQIKGLQWMVSLYNNRLNGILADEMGLGKTIQTISLITFLMEKKLQKGPYLVIVPLSTITNWTLEFERWAPSVATIVYKGNPDQRKTLQTAVRAGNFNVLLTTYDFVIKDKAALSKLKWIHMIIDEGHRMKNAHSKLTATLTQYYSTRYRLILTGTPLQNNLPELWAILNFVLPKIFNSVKNFEDWFNTPFASSGERVELNEEESLLIIRRLHKVLRPFLLRRLKKDVESELPDKVEVVLKCSMSALQSNLYQQLKTNGFLRVSGGSKAGGKVTMQGFNNIIIQLRKICNHPFTFDSVIDAFGRYEDVISSPEIVRVAGKFELLDRIIPKLRASNHKILMFFQMTKVMDIMEDYLAWKGIVRNVNYLRLDGSTKADDRTEMLTSFNGDPNKYIFLLSTRAGGLGLNLQSADTVIIYDSDWNPHQDLQAQDRAHRIGQTKEVRVLRLVTSNSVEETILGIAQQKLDMDGKVIQAGKFDQKSTNEEREAFLRALLETQEPDDDEEKTNNIDNDDELNEIIARNDDELELFKRMDAERLKEGTRRNGVVFESASESLVRSSRMITDDELPQAYLSMIAEPLTKEDESLSYGRGGHRASKENKVYDDGLTDGQFLRMMERDADEAEAERGGAKAKRGAKKAHTLKLNAAQSGSEEDRSGSDSDGEPAASAAMEDSDDNDVAPPTKRGKRARSEAPEEDDE